MYHLSLEKCNSTQLYLKEKIEEGSVSFPAIITTKQQTAGVGRRGNNWISNEKSLCFSCLLNPNETLTLTPLEIAVMIVNFFNEKFKQNIRLKWPNDLIHPLNNEKIGGIICENKNGIIILGIGINLSQVKNSSIVGQLPPGYLDIQTDPEVLALEMYKYFLKNRLDSKSVISSWHSMCLHLNAPVYIEDEQNQGLFIGVGKMGEALLMDTDSQETKSYFSGSLYFKS